ncbi:membrane protein insertase YidC [Rhizobium sp. L1K21]|uniref:membrane protein insertase YidC n=1 Tax=Rhizobium sp. L1K21 TaxID=2954933 RepID=UPI002091FCB4|nr:membrane protein insertase YidC [Rhizobium sp. L1K21]MCO6185582.1 membrane protein insertase YidC [Rhizobium sp. L1K21]
MENNRNYFIAIALSVIILFGWQYFYMGPKMQAERAASEQAAQTQASGDTTANPQTPAAGSAQVSGDTPSASGSASVISRDAAIAEGKRIQIDTPSLSGSINLTGARLDDLHLKDYHETVDPTSPLITLLNPAKTSDGYFAEFGYVGANNMPGPNTVWTVEGNPTLTPDTPVTLTYDNGEGLTFKRTISVDAHYMFSFADEVTNNGSAAASIAEYGRVTRYRAPDHASTYVIHEGFTGWLGENGLKEVKYSSAEDENSSFNGVSTGWLGITDKYWAATIIPPQDLTYDARYSHFNDGTPRFQADFKTAGVDVAPGATVEFKSLAFAGAKEVPVVDGYAASTSWFDQLFPSQSAVAAEDYRIPSFDRLIDWGWFYFLTKPMFKLMDFLYRFLGNFGLAILATTIIIKGIFFPLASKQYASMANMKRMQPKMEELKQKYGDDRMALQQATMQLYKEEKINPVAGCWPVLLQIPVFFSLYKVIYVTIEMRHAPFFGWIKDLSAPDPTTIVNLFGLLPFEAPTFLHLGVWPIIMGITMFLQMRMNPTPPDPAQAMIFTWMPVVFTFMLASFPAGLVIYWAWNNTLSIIQQSVIMKRHGVKVELWGNLKGLFKRGSKDDKKITLK